MHIPGSVSRKVPVSLVKFWKALVQILGEVPEGSGADAEARFRKVQTNCSDVLPAARGKKVKKIQAVGDST